MAQKTAIVTLEVEFRVTLNQYGEVESVEPMRDHKHMMRRAWGAAEELDMDDFEAEVE